MHCPRQNWAGLYQAYLIGRRVISRVKPAQFCYVEDPNPIKYIVASVQGLVSVPTFVGTQGWADLFIGDRLCIAAEKKRSLSTRHRKKGSEIEEDIFCRVA